MARPMRYRSWTTAASAERQAHIDQILITALNLEHDLPRLFIQYVRGLMVRTHTRADTRN